MRKQWLALFLGGSKITADGDWSHEIKRKKAMTNLDSILKSKNITLPTKVCLLKAMVFPVVMYGWKSWIIKKAEHQRIDAFELWCWRGLLRDPWTARRSNQSILKEISLGYSLEGLMLKLKLQYFGHLMGRTDSLEKTLILGKTECGRRRGRQKRSWLNCRYQLDKHGFWKRDTVREREMRHKNSEKSEDRGTKVKVPKLNPSQLYYTFSREWKNKGGVKL